MKIIICVDSNGGISFNNRRQSQDRILRQKVAELCNGSPLFLNEYSAKMFGDEYLLNISGTYLADASDTDFCFVEEESVDFDKVGEVYLFNWNRKYPADKFFKFDAKVLGFTRRHKEEFAGSSHEKITLEIFAKKV